MFALGVLLSAHMATLVQLAVQELLGIDVVLAKIDRVLGVVTKMSVDVAALDAALASFASDLDTALASIQAKLDALATPLDLSSEVATISTAQARLDQFVSGLDPAPPAVSDPPATSDPSQGASGVTTGVFDNATTSSGTSDSSAETPGNGTDGPPA